MEYGGEYFLDDNGAFCLYVLLSLGSHEEKLMRICKLILAKFSSISTNFSLIFFFGWIGAFKNIPPREEGGEVVSVIEIWKFLDPD